MNGGSGLGHFKNVVLFKSKKRAPFSRRQEVRGPNTGRVSIRLQGDSLSLILRRSAAACSFSLIAVIALTGCIDEGPDAEDAAPIHIPTDGTWEFEEGRSSFSGYGEWSIEDSEVDERFDHFSYKIDTPPTVTQEGNGLVIQSTVHVKRVGEGYVSLDLVDLHASLIPGVSMTDEEGDFRYDETYGDAMIECAKDVIQIGEETTCTLTYEERSHPEWLQDSYWLMHGTYIGTWPSQTETY